MRVAPVGLFAPAIGEDAAVFETASDAAALTHGNPAGYLAAGYLAVVLARLVRGEDLDVSVDAADRSLQGRRDSSEVRRAVDAARAMASRGTPSPEQLEELGAGWIAEEALAIAICCATVASDFSDGVLLAVNHSGDSDSTGSIAGNLLGAKMGLGSIPSPWLDRLEMRPEIERVAADLAATALGERDPSEAWQSYPGW